MLLIGDKILECRKAANLSQEEFAAKVGVTRQAVSKWELDKAYPDLDKLVDICDIFHISMTEFLYGKPETALPENDSAAVGGKSAGQLRGKGAFVRLCVLSVLLGGLFVFCAVICFTVLGRNVWPGADSPVLQARIERVYQQYTKADLCVYDDVGRKVVKTVWLDADGIRDGDFISCRTNEKQDGIFYAYRIGTLVILPCLVLLFLVLFLLSLGEIVRFCKENRWEIRWDGKADSTPAPASKPTAEEKETVERI